MPTSTSAKLPSRDQQSKLQTGGRTFQSASPIKKPSFKENSQKSGTPYPWEGRRLRRQNYPPKESKPFSPEFPAVTIHIPIFPVRNHSSYFSPISGCRLSPDGQLPLTTIRLLPFNSLRGQGHCFMNSSFYRVSIRCHDFMVHHPSVVVIILISVQSDIKNITRSIRWNRSRPKYYSIKKSA